MFLLVSPTGSITDEEDDDVVFRRVISGDVDEDDTQARRMAIVLRG